MKRVFGKLKAVASLDAYQITNCQFLSKTYHFLLPDFRRIREISFYREFYGQMPEQVWSKGLFDFSKSCPSRHQDFQKISKWKKVFIKTDCLLIMITNHFEIPVVQNLTTFSFFFCIVIYFLFKSINKIHDDKMCLKQVYSFHANANIKAKFTFFKKCIHKWKHS